MCKLFDFNDDDNNDDIGDGLFGSIFKPLDNTYLKPSNKDPDWDDPNNFENPDNCSDREWMDDEDYDDFDN